MWAQLLSGGFWLSDSVLHLLVLGPLASAGPFILQPRPLSCPMPHPLFYLSVPFVFLPVMTVSLPPWLWPDLPVSASFHSTFLLLFQAPDSRPPLLVPGLRVSLLPSAEQEAGGTQIGPGLKCRTVAPPHFPVISVMTRLGHLCHRTSATETDTSGCRGLNYSGSVKQHPGPAQAHPIVLVTQGRMCWRYGLKGMRVSAHGWSSPPGSAPVAPCRPAGVLLVRDSVGQAKCFRPSTLSCCSEWQVAPGGPKGRRCSHILASES